MEKPTMRSYMQSPFSFSRSEIKDLAKSLVIISLVFTIARFGLSAMFTSGFAASLMIAALTVGIGFLFHESAHKFMAIRFRKRAEYKADTTTLAMSLILSLAGIIFVAPGAVMIRGTSHSGAASRKEIGIISLAGPAANIALAVLFLAAGALMNAAAAPSLLTMIAYYGAYINSWLALFNMLPFWSFDGAKVFAWSKAAYAAGLAASAVLLYTAAI